MDKNKLYYKIIGNRINNPLEKDIYGENHHIIPKSLGGSNLKKNIVRLTAREHYICHYLLSEMYKPKSLKWYKMQLAFSMMNCSSFTHENRYFNSRLYEWKKKDFAESMKFMQGGENNSQSGTMWIHNIELRKSIKCKKTEIESYINNGWLKGRILNFESAQRKNDLQNLHIQNKLKHKQLDIDNFSFKGKHISLQRRNLISKTFNVNMIDNFNESCEQVKTLLNKLYVVDRLLTTEIAKLYNINNETIRTYLKIFR